MEALTRGGPDAASALELYLQTLQGSTQWRDELSYALARMQHRNALDLILDQRDLNWVPLCPVYSKISERTMPSIAALWPSKARPGRHGARNVELAQLAGLAERQVGAVIRFALPDRTGLATPLQSSAVGSVGRGVAS